MPRNQSNSAKDQLRQNEERAMSMFTPNFDNHDRRSENAKNLDIAENKVQTPTKESIAQREAEGGQTNKTPWQNNVSDKKNKPKPKGILQASKKYGAAILIATTLLFGAGGSFLYTAAAPVAYVMNTVGDLNDAVAASDIAGFKILKYKTPLTDDIVSGCTVLSIRCRFKTMTPKMVASYNKAGVEVLSDKTKFGRSVVYGYKFRGETMDAETFHTKAKTDPNLRQAVKSGKNMKYLTVSDNTFIRKVLKRFGISMKPIELTGSHEDRVNKLMNRVDTDDIQDLKFLAYDEKDNPLEDSSGKIAYVDSSGNVLNPDGSIDTSQTAAKFRLDGTDIIYDSTNFKKAQVSIDNIKAKNQKLAQRPPIEVNKNVLSIVNVLGWLDIACSLKNAIGAASVAAKIGNSLHLAQYAMPVLSLAGSMKAGEISEEDSKVLGEFFMNVDERKTITGIKTMNSDGSGEVGEIPNPNYGKNVMNSNLYEMSSTGKFTSPNIDNKNFSVGLGTNTIASIFSGVSSVMDAIINLGSKDDLVCNVVQNWAVRGVGVIIGLITATGTGGASVGVGILQNFGFSLALMQANSFIVDSITGSIIGSDMDKSPSSRAAALWTGLSVITGESAKARGLIPGNSDQIVAYAKLKNESNQDYLAIESKKSSPLDTSNPYSFLSRFISSIASYSNTSDDFILSFSKIASLVTGSFSYVVDSQITHASTLDKTRFEQCNDTTYQSIGIDADVQCNLRYIMPDADLELDVDEVALYMENNGYVEPNTTTGLPKGYVAPKQSDSQGIIMDAIKGFPNSLISDYFNFRSTQWGVGNGAEYGKYLDYCVYRTMPYGETYEESGAVGSADSGWINGTKCLETGEPYNYFRMYTLYKTVNNMDEEFSENYTEGIPLAQNTATTGNTTTTNPTTGAVNPNVGVGGLDFQQAVSFMNYYYNNKYALQGCPGEFFCPDDYINQCTAFTYYFNTKFITTGTGRGNGEDVVGYLLSDHSDKYTQVYSSNIQPFSIYSLDGNYGHTGVILGVGSDGSIIVGEANVELSESYNGLIEKEVFGSYDINDVVSVSHWDSITSWENAMSSDWNLTNPSYAAPVEADSVLSKVQASLN